MSRTKKSASVKSGSTVATTDAKKAELKAMLESLGFTVALASDATKAPAKTKKTSPKGKTSKKASPKADAAKAAAKEAQKEAYYARKAAYLAKKPFYDAKSKFNKEHLAPALRAEGLAANGTPWAAAIAVIGAVDFTDKKAFAKAVAMVPKAVKAAKKASESEA